MGKKKESLGRALIKDRSSKTRDRKHVEDNSMLHTTEVNDGYDWGRLNLQSVTAESSLQEFLSTAELAQREFTAEKLNIKYVKSAPSEVTLATSQPDFDEPLTVPRRPQWTPEISADDQSIRERDSFLEWRRHLNKLQAKLGAAVTPYERNIELWRQLWRTIEKSDVVLILLDARNPLLFRCADLEKYAAEQNCKCILLLNKADLTSEYERECWAEYFTKEKIPAVFFSAAKSSKTEKTIAEENDELSRESNSEDDTNSETDTMSEEKCEPKGSDDEIELFKKQLCDLDESVTNTAIKLANIQNKLDRVIEGLKTGTPMKIIEKQFTNETVLVEEDAVENSSDISDRDKLLSILKGEKTNSLRNPPRLTVGMIGYPNVGKSSTVNVLMQTKKVSVSSMPGHTRFVQSLILDEDIDILDCPGLVLPAYAVTPDLLLTAVLPIDQMRSQDSAMARLCQLVSKHTFETKYGLLLPQHDSETGDLDYKQILTAHAFNRGFMTAAGQPDQSRSARLLLKDAATGRLRWAVLPAGATPAPLGTNSGERRKDTRRPTPRETSQVEGWVSKSDEIDKAFFSMNSSTVHVKGKPVMGMTAAQAQQPRGLTAKPWKLEKKHANKNKREKLRRVYAHLDEH